MFVQLSQLLALQVVNSPLVGNNEKKHYFSNICIPLGQYLRINETSSSKLKKSFVTLNACIAECCMWLLCYLPMVDICPAGSQVKKPWRYNSISSVRGKQEHLPNCFNGAVPKRVRRILDGNKNFILLLTVCT